MLVRPAMKGLFCLKAKNGLGRFALSALPHYKMGYSLYFNLNTTTTDSPVDTCSPVFACCTYE